MKSQPINQPAVKSMVSEEMAQHTPEAMRAAEKTVEGIIQGCCVLTNTNRTELISGPEKLISVCVEIIDRETGLPELLAQRDDLLGACEKVKQFLHEVNCRFPEDAQYGASCLNTIDAAIAKAERQNHG